MGKHRLKSAAVLLLLIMSALLLASCGKKYKDAKEVFSDAKKLETGEFNLGITADIKKGEDTIGLKYGSSGLKDGSAAVFKTDYEIKSGDVSQSEKYGQVLSEDVSAVHDNILFFLYEAAENNIKIDGKDFSAGTDDAASAADMTGYLADLCKEAGSEELYELMNTVSGDLRQEDAQAAVNVKGSIDKELFKENVSAEIRFEDYEISLTFDYSIKEKEVSYSSEEDYVTLRTVSFKFYTAFEDLLASSGVYVPEGREIKSHVVDSSSLIIEGIDEEFYKTTWDDSLFEYASESSNLELGQWALSGSNVNASVIFSMFDMDADGIIAYYEETYGDNMTVKYTREEYEGKAGKLTHVVMNLVMETEGATYTNNMFLYEVGEGFTIQCMLTNDSNLTDEELADAAFASFDIYKAV